MQKSLLVGWSILVISAVVSADIVEDLGLEFVTIGNTDNIADTTGYGAVDYAYQIGKYEVTNSQWNTFVSTAGKPTGDIRTIDAYDGRAYFSDDKMPTNMVSWLEATQFCNYLTSGDKSLGAYQFSGDNNNPGEYIGIDRDSAIHAYGTVYVIPTEDEWYKAAYYTGNGYSKYANGLDTAPAAGDDSNYNMAVGSPWGVNMGNGTPEQNGTFDMMGNIFEWNETAVNGTSLRVLRGGSFFGPTAELMSSSRYSIDSSYEGTDVGFRIAAVTPEPTTVLLLSLGALGLRRRR